MHKKAFYNIILIQFFFQSYREYHSDIFPETYGLEPASGPENWWTGSNTSVTKMSLDPLKRPKENLTIFQGPLTERDPKRVSQNGQANAPAQNSQNGTAVSIYFLNFAWDLYFMF